MTRDRAAEIIGAYGADAQRWPVAERAAALALVTGDLGMQAELAVAATLDTGLADWAAAPVTGVPFDLTTLPAARPSHRWRWFGGGIAASALAAGLAVLMPVTPPAPVSVAQAAVPAPADSEAFASVFTPTNDEELLI